MIAAGATHVFLEKPGAPSVAELQEMKAYAASKGVPVYMGYNKNVTPYVQKVGGGGGGVVVVVVVFSSSTTRT